jgi:invasion protein IalB
MTTNAKRNCTAVQQVFDREGRRAMFAWIVGKTDEGATAAMFQTLPGVALQKGIEFKFENGVPRRAAFVMCNPQACEASMPINDAIVKEAMAAINGNATATVIILNGEAVNFTLPLKGFDKVMAALRG